MATHAINDLAAHAFELVNKELASTLDAARAELEDYVDGRAGPTRCCAPPSICMPRAAR